jgi:hypothetical protein
MIAEKTIKICGKEVQMRYCAAAETGYERLSGQSSDIFVPDVEKDEDGNIKNVIQKAKADDYIKLAIAAIIAAYARKEQDPPITADDIIYDAEPEEVSALITSVVELRAKWYNIPTVVSEQNDTPEETEEGDDKPKNA